MKSIAPDDLLVDLATSLEVVHAELATLLAFPALHDVHERNSGGLCAGLRGKPRLVGGAWNAVPLVESLSVREPPPRASQVPLAEGARGVARGRQGLSERDLPLREPVERAGERHGMGA